MMEKEEWREQNGYELIQASNSKTISFGWLKKYYISCSPINLLLSSKYSKSEMYVI